MAIKSTYQAFGLLFHAVGTNEAVLVADERGDGDGRQLARLRGRRGARGGAVEDEQAASALDLAEAEHQRPVVARRRVVLAVGGADCVVDARRAGHALQTVRRRQNHAP